MIEAAFDAIMMANGTVPATAPATFQAGVYNGFTGKDLRSQWEACFPADQKLADATDGLIKAVEAKDLDALKALYTEFHDQVEGDIAPCEAGDYPEVDDAYHDQGDLVSAAKSDPNWQIKAMKALMPHMKEVKAGATAALSKWDSGDYYGAGQEIGKIDKIIFAPWEGKRDAFLQ